MRYNRALAPAFLALLLPTAPLGAFLHGLVVAEFRGTGLTLDLHLRESNDVMLYLGSTRLLLLRYQPRTNTLWPSADAYYMGQDSWQFKPPYARTEVADLVAALALYLASVEVNPRHYSKEGALQNRLSYRFGPGRRSPDDWVVVDREVVLGYQNQAEKAAEWEPIKERAKAVGRKIPGHGSHNFGSTFERFSAGDELDLLVWVPGESRFLIVELKDGSDNTGVYKSPLQVAVYTAAWRHFAQKQPKEFLTSLRVLLSQKRALGLIACKFPMPDRESLRALHPALIIQEPNTRSRSWRIIDTVRDVIDREWPREAQPDGDLEPSILTGLRIYSAPAAGPLDALTDIAADYPNWQGAGRR
ncbi:MAG: hypothetical protein ACYC5Q_07160 [Thermoleophilia bacterium]